MTPEQIEKILAELALLRAEMVLISEAAKNSEFLLLMLAGAEQPKISACDWMRQEGVDLWPVN